MFGAGVLTLVFVLFVWPTPYRSIPLAGAPVDPEFQMPILAARENRVTGEVTVLIGSVGWVYSGPRPAPGDAGTQLDSLARKYGKR